MDLMKRSSESEENLSGMTLVYPEALPESPGTNWTLVSSSDSSSEEPESESSSMWDLIGGLLLALAVETSP